MKTTYYRLTCVGYDRYRVSSFDMVNGKLIFKSDLTCVTSKKLAQQKLDAITAADKAKGCRVVIPSDSNHVAPYKFF